MNENTRTNYINTLCTKINEKLTPAISARHTLVEKHNDLLLDAITFDIPDVKISPVIYIHKLLEEMPDVNTAADKVIEIFKNSSTPDINLDSMSTHLSDEKWIKDHVLPKLTSTPASDVISLPFMDMFISFYVNVMDNGFITLRKGSTNLTAEVLLHHAKQNAFFDYRLKGMLETLRELKPDMTELIPESEEETMYILSSRNGMFGAAAMIDDNILAAAAQELKSNLYILPSSIHECIILKADCPLDTNILKDMVKSINETEVSQSDYLSDSVFIYIKDRSHLQFA